MSDEAKAKWKKVGNALLWPFEKIGSAASRIFNAAKADRIFFLAVAVLEIIVIGLAIGWIGTMFFDAGFITYMIGMMIWIAIVGYTPLVNSFFIVVPRNAGAVISNVFRTYETYSDDKLLTRLQPTKALREVGPGLHGLLLWEKVGWVLNLGKQVVIDKPVTTYSRDHIELTIDWQVILTPLQGYLINLVRHEEDTVKRYFEGRFRSKLIDVVSKQYAQDVLDEDGVTVLKHSIFEQTEDLNELKEGFKNFFGGTEGLHDDEKQFGTFTNEPQLISIRRSPDFQKSVESLSINNNNVRALNNLRDKAGLEANLALIAVLASQGKPTDNIRDVAFSGKIQGLENLQNLTIMPGAVPLETAADGKKDQKKGNK